MLIPNDCFVPPARRFQLGMLLGGRLSRRWQWWHRCTVIILPFLSSFPAAGGSEARPLSRLRVTLLGKRCRDHVPALGVAAFIPASAGILCSRGDFVFRSSRPTPPSALSLEKLHQFFSIPTGFPCFPHPCGIPPCFVTTGLGGASNILGKGRFSSFFPQ